jgi:hypothetical protein
MQQGIYAAKNIILQAAGKSLVKFRYNDEGSMATIDETKPSPISTLLHLAVILRGLDGYSFTSISDWLKKSDSGSLPMDLGLLHLRQRRASDLQ